MNFSIAEIRKMLELFKSSKILRWMYYYTVTVMGAVGGGFALAAIIAATATLISALTPFL